MVPIDSLPILLDQPMIPINELSVTLNWPNSRGDQWRSDQCLYNTPTYGEPGWRDVYR